MEYLPYLLYIVLFLHQTATKFDEIIQTSGCISFYSYIKPQRHFWLYASLQLYIVLFLHQTATTFILHMIQLSCISFYSYIKPQQLLFLLATLFVVYRSIPTSNRNYPLICSCSVVLYIVLFLHQTATCC